MRVLVLGGADDRALSRHADGQAHEAAIDAAHFDRWLGLFEATAHELCPPVAAVHFVERARRIASSLEMGVASGQGVMLAVGERYRRDPPSSFPGAQLRN